MILNKNILILEDNLKTLAKILEKLWILEGDQPYEFSTVVITNYVQVEKLINNSKDISFDVILLDRDCKLGGSFHTLDIERFGADKVIAISAVPEFNEDAKKRGVKRTILKDIQNLDQFTTKVVSEVEEVVRKSNSFYNQ